MSNNLYLSFLQATTESGWHLRKHHRSNKDIQQQQMDMQGKLPGYPSLINWREDKRQLCITEYQVELDYYCFWLPL
jgi:hypothetical protein